jgi:hypothetical protein
VLQIMTLCTFIDGSPALGHLHPNVLSIHIFALRTPICASSWRHDNSARTAAE